MSWKRIIISLFVSGFMLMLCLVLKHGTDLILAVLISPPATILILGGVLSALLLQLASQRKRSVKILEAMHLTLPMMVTIACLLSMIGVFLHLDQPSLIGPDAMPLFTSIVQGGFLLACVVFPLKFRLEVEELSPHTSSIDIKRSSLGMNVRLVLAFIVFMTSVITCLVLKKSTDLIPMIIFSPPTAVLFLGSLVSSLMLSYFHCRPKLALKALLTTYVPTQEETVQIVKLLQNLKVAISLTTLVGLCLGIMKVFWNLDRAEYIGPGLVVAFNSILYGIVLYVLLIIPFEFRMQVTSNRGDGVPNEN